MVLHAGVYYEMIVRGEDLALRPEDGINGYQEVTLQFRKTKSDQLSFGTNKTMRRTEVQHVYMVEALERLKEVAPRRFKSGP